MSKLLPLSDFRSRREILRPTDFAIGPRKETKPTDLISPQDWHEITILPEDVAVRTSNHNGTRLHNLVSLWAEWLDVVGDDVDEFLYIPILDAADEFQAATFDALHGYYRQGIAGLRSACDSISIAAACQARSIKKDYRSWRRGTKSLSFGWACDNLGAHPPTKRIEAILRIQTADSLFDQKRAPSAGGWARRAYSGLSQYVHATPKFTNIAFWASNGPIYDQTAFFAFCRLFVEATLLCHLFVAIARPDYPLPPVARHNLMACRSKWSRTARGAFRLRFSLPALSSQMNSRGHS